MFVSVAHLNLGILQADLGYKQEAEKVGSQFINMPMKFLISLQAFFEKKEEKKMNKERKKEKERNIDKHKTIHLYGFFLKTFQKHVCF